MHSTPPPGLEVTLYTFLSSSVSAHKCITNVVYLSADPDDIMSPSGDHEHLIKFWNANQKRIYDANIIWTLLNQTIHSQNLMATVCTYVPNIIIPNFIRVKPLQVWVLWSQELSMLTSALACHAIFLSYVSSSHNPPPPHGEEDCMTRKIVWRAYRVSE